jgi:hypothetical protein
MGKFYRELQLELEPLLPFIRFMPSKSSDGILQLSMGYPKWKVGQEFVWILARNVNRYGYGEWHVVISSALQQGRVILRSMGFWCLANLKLQRSSCIRCDKKAERKSSI